MTSDNLLEVGDVLKWTEDSIPNIATIVRVTPKRAWISKGLWGQEFKRKCKFWNGCNSDNGFYAESVRRPIVRYKVTPKQ